MIAENLYHLRVYKAHITQRELSELSGVTNVAISCLERGLRIPQKATVQKLADALGVSVKELTE